MVVTGDWECGRAAITRKMHQRSRQVEFTMEQMTPDKGIFPNINVHMIYSHNVSDTLML